MDATVRLYNQNDIKYMAEIWNEVILSGTAFPQEETLDIKSAVEFFGAQTACGAAETGSGIVAGLYILHPNNVGRCGHICDASYAVLSEYRGRGIGEALVRHCIGTAAAYGFKILQFNAVVASNTPALMLYKKLGFVPLGTIPNGFRMPNGSYADIIPHYLTLNA